MAVAARRFYSPEEYLAMERAAEYKSEYLSGEIFAMAGTSERHALITSNISITIGGQLKPRGCKTYITDLRVNVGAAYFYPDIAVVCGKAELIEDGYLDNLLNPTLVVEVLSKSTEAYDRGEKFARYAGIKSLSTYVLVSQDQPKVEVFSRQPDNSWNIKTFASMSEMIELPHLDLSMTIADVYDQVEFGGVRESARPGDIPLLP
jgi:Uma2 family endonuclease